jgi:uncharacterized protein YjbJ (UPF0337 family)
MLVNFFEAVTGQSSIFIETAGTGRPVGTFTTQKLSRSRFGFLEATMDWNRIEGDWKQAKGKVKEKWGKLTDDDLAQINGQREQLEGKIQQRYGFAKDMARKDIDDWLKSTP